MNPMLVTTNAPFYYNPLLLPHLFSTGALSLNMNDNNGCISLEVDRGRWVQGAQIRAFNAIVHEH